MLTEEIFAKVALKTSVIDPQSIGQEFTLTISFVVMINEPVGDPVVGIKKWSTVNQIIPEEFAYKTLRKGS